MELAKLRSLIVSLLLLALQHHVEAQKQNIINCDEGKDGCTPAVDISAEEDGKDHRGDDPTRMLVEAVRFRWPPRPPTRPPRIPRKPRPPRGPRSPWPPPRRRLPSPLPSPRKPSPPPIMMRPSPLTSTRQALPSQPSPSKSPMRKLLSPAPPPPRAPTSSITAASASFGQNLPQPEDPLGASYGIWKPYRPTECPQLEHDKFWVRGPDSKIYPTWHPSNWTEPGTGRACSFGHEHGDDPRQGPWPDELLPFGYLNEVYNNKTVSMGGGMRNEDHVGHKVQWQKGIRVWSGNDNRNGTVISTCDAQLKLHQGTYSPDALTNNMHELFYRLNCTHGIEIDWKIIATFGDPGFLHSSCNDGTLGVYVGPAKPPDSVFGSGRRQLANATCVEEKILVPPNGTSSYGKLNNEHWVVNFATQGNNLTFTFNPYFTVFDPTRYHDLRTSTKIAYSVDICYRTEGDRMARGGACEAMRRLAPNGMAWDDPRSYWKGANRNFSPNRPILKNWGPSVRYTDALGKNVRETPFPNSVRQFVKGNQPEQTGDVFMYNRDFGDAFIHAPN